MLQCEIGAGAPPSFLLFQLSLCTLQSPYVHTHVHTHTHTLPQHADLSFIMVKSLFGCEQPSAFLSLQTDVNACYLRSARAGNLEKTLDYLKNGVDINICNQVPLFLAAGLRAGAFWDVELCLCSSEWSERSSSGFQRGPCGSGGGAHQAGRQRGRSYQGVCPAHLSRCQCPHLSIATSGIHFDPLRITFENIC